MLWVKRLLTGCACFPVLVIVLWFGSLVVAGAIAGGVAGARDPENAAAAGEKAGQRMAEKFGVIFLVAAVGVAGAVSLAAMFLAPWCRDETPPEGGREDGSLGFGGPSSAPPPG